MQTVAKGIKKEVEFSSAKTSKRGTVREEQVGNKKKKGRDR
jgi:hypothetical protein